MCGQEREKTQASEPFLTVDSVIALHSQITQRHQKRMQNVETGEGTNRNHIRKMSQGVVGFAVCPGNGPHYGSSGWNVRCHLLIVQLTLLDPECFPWLSLSLVTGVVHLFVSYVCLISC